MATHYLFVGSITHAMRGRRLLEAQGVRSFLHRSSHTLDKQGCGYSLLVTESPQRAEQILRGGGVRVIHVSDAL